MTRARWFLLIAAVAAGCTSAVQVPNADFRGPAALAVFDGFVAHESGSIRPFLAIANSWGDDLRLVDTTDNEVVTSPGLVFPLSIPSSGRPLFLAAADLNDDTSLAAHDRPDALVVVSSGSNVVEIVDTWSGQPTVVSTVDLEPLAPGATVVSMIGASVPTSPTDGTPAIGVGRILVGLSAVDATGGKLAVLDFRRDALDPAGMRIGAPTTSLLVGLGFDPVSLTQWADPGLPYADARLVYAASREPLPGGTLGVAELDLGALPAWTLRELDALVPTEQVAVSRFDGWVPGTADTFTEAPVSPVTRVVAIPVASACGESPKPVPCGLLAIDPVAPWEAGRGNLAPNYEVGTVPAYLDGMPYLLPIALPAPVSGLLATGRAGNRLIVTAQSGGVVTTGLAVLASDDGKVYLVDLARWTMPSDTSPTEGTGKTRVSIAQSDGAIGLWNLDHLDTPLVFPPTLSNAPGELPARVRVTPGFTPDDVWTLTYQGALPALESSAAVIGRDGAGLWLAVQIESGLPASTTAVAELAALGVAPGDLVEIGGSGSLCPSGTELTVDSIDELVPEAQGGAIRFLGAPPTCLATQPLLGATATDVATVRSSGLVLSGLKTGHAGRPTAIVAGPTNADEFPVPGDRRFYVTDPCPVGSECRSNWTGGPIYDLAFPFPAGPVLGLIPGFVSLPARGNSLVFFTSNGLVPSGRKPLIKGTALASPLATGLALVDSGLNGRGARVYTAFTAGTIMSFSSADSPTSVTIIR